MNILVGPIESFYEFIRMGIESVVQNPNISYGLAIIALTIIVKLCLLPLTIKQIKSMNKAQAIQPELKKLQERYKNDPNRLNQEMMKLYKENDANPMSSCLPMLIQMPILFALFTVFREIPGLEGVSFVLTPWVKSLAGPDPLYILPVLSAGLMWVSMKFSSANAGASAQSSQMNMMNTVMTVMIFVMSIRFSSALLLYWVASNIIQLVQTYALRNLRNSDPVKS